MKKNYFKLILALVAFVFSKLSLNSQITQTFSFTGSLQTFTVPSCVGQVSIDMAGAAGANAIDVNPLNSVGGRGGRITGVLTVTPGQVFNIYVGSAGNATTGVGGYNGGGNGGLSSAGTGCNGGFAGGGGGASDIRIGGITLSDRVVVAGGGGGAGRDYCNGSCQPCGCGGSGGAGGGLTGNNGLAANNCNFGYPGTGVNLGGGGGVTAGGVGGLADGGNSPSGVSGSLGNGGAGAGGTYDVAGGGGGGGFYGGGGGGSAGSGSGVGGGGGGGGSSFLGAMTSAVTTPSFQLGNGYLTITYIVNGGIVSATASNTLICSGANVSINASGTVLSYTWNTGSNNSGIAISPTSNTVISVAATNSIGCISNATVGITVNNNPTLTVVTSTNVTCLGKTVTLTATGANTYTWTNNITNGVSYSPSVTATYTVIGQNACSTASAVTTISVAPLAVSVLSTPTVVCAGSTSTLTAAAAATSFSWFPIIANSSSLIVSPNVSTIYTVAVSDGTCSGNATIAVNALPVPTIAATPTLTTVCSGIPVGLNATGGVSYTWTPGNLSGASVTVAPNVPTGFQVVGSNSLGCTALANVVIITNPSPTMNVVIDNNLVCSGDPVNISATGANIYLWDNGSNASSISVNPLTTTVYSLTGTSNNCSITQTIQVTVFTPTLSISGPTAICVGQSATITASGANTYAWNNGFTTPVIQVNPNTTSIYNLTALTSSSGINCPSSASLQLIVKPNPTVTAVTTKTTICKGESAVINASGASTYSWSTSAITSSIVITSSLVTTIGYSVVGTSTNGCTSTASLQVKINACTGIKENSGINSLIKIYPNPSNGEFNVEYISEIKLNIINELGQLIRTLNLNQANEFKAHVAGLSDGIYFINGQSAAQKIEQKIIVQK
jgi:hypothetical protein